MAKGNCQLKINRLFKKLAVVGELQKQKQADYIY